MILYAPYPAETPSVDQKAHWLYRVVVTGAKTMYQLVQYHEDMRNFHITEHHCDCPKRYNHWTGCLVVINYGA